jgi:hypothetical protein
MTTNGTVEAFVDGAVVRVNPTTGECFDKHGRLCTLARSQKYIRIGKAQAHRVIWEAVNGPIPPKIQVNHINGIKTDNRIENLDLVTNSGNMKHAYRTGLSTIPMCRGEKHGNSKLTEDAVREIRRLRADGKLTTWIAERFGIKKQTVSLVLSGQTWGHVK